MTKKKTKTPASREAEQGVLSCMLQDPRKVMPKLMRDLTEAHFHFAESKEVAKAMLSLHNDGKKIDHITVCQRLEQAKILETIGGRDYIVSLQEFAPDVSNVGAYVDVLVDKLLMRQAQTLCEETASRISDEEHDVAGALSFLHEGASGLLRSNTERAHKPIADHVDQFLDEYNDTLSGERIPSMDTRWPIFNRKIGGVFNGYTIISGPSSSGKSALAYTILSDALKKKRAAFLASYEIPETSCIKRIICNLTGIGSDYLFKPHISKPSKDLQRTIADTARWLRGQPLEIIHDVGMGVSAACEHAKLLAERHRSLIMVIDYLQIAPSPAMRQKQPTQEMEICENSSIIRNFTKKHKEVCGIALSQLTKREDGTFVTRGSGSLDMDADDHYRIDPGRTYMNRRQEEVTEASKGIYVVKQRNGERNFYLPLFLDGEHFTFKE